MTKEEKLIEVLNKHWKGLMEFRDLSQYERENWKKEYTIIEIYDMLTDAYNLGIEEAAKNASIRWSDFDIATGGKGNMEPYLDRNSILKLKI